MAFRFLDPNPIYWANDGTMCAGGTLRFYENNSTTPTNAGEGQDLSPSLGATITLDSSGRAEDDVWLASGSYRARLYNADDELQWSRDYVQDADGLALTPLDPADGNEDDVYSTDGIAALWRAIREVADPTGHSGKYYGNDGAVTGWYAFPAATVYDEDSLPGGIAQDATTFRVGNLLVQTGSGTAATSGTTATSEGVTFGAAFDTAPVVVGVTPTVGSVTSEGAHVSAQATSITTSGFTANFFAGAEDGGGDLSISTPVTFRWIAFGIKAP